MKPAKDKDGYLLTSLSNPVTGVRKSMRISRMVAEAFIPNPNNYKQVNHKDEDVTNNYVYNLEWCDTKYNNNYGTKIERQSVTRKRPVYQYTLDFKFIKMYDGAIDAERETGILRSSICFCIKGRTKSAGGYIWTDRPITNVNHEEETES